MSQTTYKLWIVDPSDMPEDEQHPLPLDEMRECAYESIEFDSEWEVLAYLIRELNAERLSDQFYYYVVEHGEYETLIHS